MAASSNIFRHTAFVFIGLTFFLGGVQLQNILNPSSFIKGENPGYFEQWFAEKKSADGTIPSWQHAKWANWDKNHVRSRASEDIIDSVLEIGPAAVGGRTRSIWIDPRNESIILAAAISGGIWRSENAGVSWKPINDQETSLMASCFTHNPFNPDIVYYGTGEGRANSADVDGNGIYKSEDGGKTFKVLASTVGKSGFETIWDIKHSLDDSNTFYVGTHSQGMFRTTDGGKTWVKSLTVGAQVNNLLVLPNNRVIASMHGVQLYASDSAGKPGTYKVITMPSWPGSGAFRRIQLANCKKFPNVVYALLEGYGFSDPMVAFYKSSDGGRNWVKRVAPSCGSGYQAYCVMLGASPVDSNIVVAGGVSIAQTNNGGTSWANKSVGHSDHHAFAALPVSTDYFLVGNDGGVYKYRYNSSAVFANLNTGYKVTQFYAGAFGPTGQVGIMGAQDNGTHVSTKPSATKSFYGADGAYAHVGLQDGKVAYLSTQNDGIRRVRNFNPNTPPSFTDNISDPIFLTDGVSFINSYNINPADQDQLYYRTNKYLYRTNDGGELWDPITTIHAGLKAIGVSNHTNPVVYTGGSAAQLYRINNASTSSPGEEYSYNTTVPSVVTNDMINAIVVHPNDKYTVFLAFSNFSNQGRVWRASGLDSAKPVYKNISGDLPPGLPVNYVAVDPLFPDKNLFAGTDFGLYFTTDSGKTWTKEIRIPNVAVHEIKMRSDRKLFIFTHGRGLWYIALKPLVPNSTKVLQRNNVSIYPNPSSNFLKIGLEVAPVNANFKIYNTIGELVATKTIVNIDEMVDLNKLNNGYYFIHIVNDGRQSTHKFLIAR